MVRLRFLMSAVFSLIAAAIVSGSMVEGGGSSTAESRRRGGRAASLWARSIGSSLASIESKLDMILEAQAKDAVGKAVADLHARVMKMEATPIAPTTGGASGGARVSARKGVVDWPADMNAPEMG